MTTVHRCSGNGLARRRLEHVFHIPGQAFRPWQLATMLRWVDRSPVELQFARQASAAADRMLAEDSAVLGRFDGERAEVKELVVKCATTGR